MITSLIGAVLASPSLIIVSWDGGADWVIDRLLAEGRLPNMAEIARTGAVAEGIIPPFPSKTAVGHVALFTGTDPSRNGVTGNVVPLMPRSAHTLLESQRGFAGEAHTADPFWVSMALGGKKAVALSAAGSYPPGPDQARIKAGGGKLANFVEFSGFETTLAPAKLLNVALPADQTLTLGDVTFRFRAFDDPKDMVVGFDSVEVTNGTKTSVLKPELASSDIGTWSQPFEIRVKGMLGLVYFRLFSLDPKTGQSELLQRETAGIDGTEIKENTEAYIRAYGGFHDSPFSLYERGLLGKTLYEGGTGEAEARAVELVKLDCTFLKRSFDFGWKKYRPEVLFHYTPMSDSAGHTWMGVLDPKSPAYNRELADKIWPYYAEVFEALDDWLGHIRRTAGKSATIAVVSDHGMAGINRYVAVNDVLQRANLMSWTSNGQIDLTKTQAVCPSWSDFAVVINGTDRKGGIVSASEREAVLARAEAALLAAVDPKTGVHLFPRVWRATDFVDQGFGGEAGGDLYFDVAPGYYPSTRKAALVTEADTIIGDGVHGFWPYRREMQSIFYVAGPTIRPQRLPNMKMIDILPTLARHLGFPIPKNATGAALRLGN